MKWPADDSTSRAIFILTMDWMHGTHYGMIVQEKQLQPKEVCVRNYFSYVAPLLLAFSFCSYAVRTPAQLKQAFTDILPAGKVARVAYAALSKLTPSSAVSNNIFVVQSDSGVIRFVSSTQVLNANEVHFTTDGRRIIFQDWSYGTCVINWDGTGYKKLNTSGNLADYYRDPVTNADMAVEVDQYYSTLTAIDIDKPSTAKTLFSTGNLGDDGQSVSSDGKYVAAFFSPQGVGIANVSSKVITPMPSAYAGGCIVNISPDANYSVMHQNSGHQDEALCTFAMSCKKVVVLTAGSGILTQPTANCNGNSPQFELTRWHEPDYLTFTVDNLKGQPYIYCMSTKKWMCIDDTLSCNMQYSTTALIIRDSFAAGTSVVRGKSSLSPRIASGNIGGTESYSLDGRRINESALRSRDGAGPVGVVVRRSAVEGTTRNAVLMSR